MSDFEPLDRDMKYRCHICSQGFTYKQNMSRHMASVHKDDRPFQCQVCRKKFKRQDHLIKHQSTVHNRTSAYSNMSSQCDICKKNFTRRYNMLKHRKIHDGQSPFECRVCKKKFTREDNLVAHYKSIHDHVKPYSCDRCEKKFSTGVHLRSHQNSVHDRFKQHECDMCGQRFTRKDHMRTHQRTVHRPDDGTRRRRRRHMNQRDFQYTVISLIESVPECDENDTSESVTKMQEDDDVATGSDSHELETLISDPCTNREDELHLDVQTVTLRSDHEATCPPYLICPSPDVLRSHLSDSLLGTIESYHAKHALPHSDSESLTTTHNNVCDDGSNSEALDEGESFDDQSHCIEKDESDQVIESVCLSDEKGE
ncbi:zinc finger protein 227-like [Corticium candelabrum]|uniref:zinc finger protein 227-like n=1 Tax=Corticium candelabrum TaxID=121492 RepID=UPI002E25E363|nr:zinc finger protein 227-like [Corticium candelabrum]